MLQQDIFVIYGGIIGMDSSDTLFILDLNSFAFEAVKRHQQREKNGKELPGPRDDFALITAQGNDDDKVKPIYMFGGFKNGLKMNDLYRLHIEDKQYVWELLEIKN